MTDMSAIMAEDSKQKSIRPPSDDDLAMVAALANEQLRLQELVAEQEEVLRGLKNQLATVCEVSLPGALEALGLMSITLSDGSKVSVKEEIYAGITEENRPAAFAWLESTGNDGIIKNEVKCQFGKGQDDEAKQLVSLLSQKGYSYVNSRSVHPQTLRAFVRKQMEGGVAPPLDIFSIHVKNVASIELKKKRITA